MNNRNGVILGLIRKLTDYGDYPSEISAESLEDVFSADVNLPDSFISVGKSDFYNYIHEKICSDNEAFESVFSEHQIVNLGSPNNYSSFVYLTRKMGLNILFTGSYKDNKHPGILMSLFMRLLIEKVFETSFLNFEKNKYQHDSFHDKIAELFEEAQKFNYELAACAVEPFWAKMTFFTNSIPLYYCSKENLSALAVNSDYTSPKATTLGAYKTFNIDYIKNSTFYLPTFGIEKDETLQSFIFNFRELLPEISKSEMHKQQKEIQTLFRSATDEQQKNFAGNSIVIFKM